MSTRIGIDEIVSLISESDKRSILNVSAMVMPDNPTQQGWSANKVKMAMWLPISRILDLLIKTGESLSEALANAFNEVSKELDKRAKWLACDTPLEDGQTVDFAEIQSPSSQDPLLGDLVIDGDGAIRYITSVDTSKGTATLGSAIINIYGYSPIPVIDEEGNLTFTFKKGLPQSPEPVNIKGPKGEPGYTFKPNIDSSFNLTWELLKQEEAPDIPSAVNIKGPKGDQGIQGPQGERGPEGKPFSIAHTYDTLNELLNDSDTSVVPVGSYAMVTGNNPAIPDYGKIYQRVAEGSGDNAWTFFVDMSNSITGPQGPQGEQGDPGVGISGIQKIGSDGLVDTYAVILTNGNQTTFTVTNGAKGDKGDKGDTGPQGPIGDTGPQGIQGVQGERGPIGPQGEPGEKGDRGEKGETGATGPIGPTGPTGPQGKKGDPGTDGVTPHIDETSGNWFIGEEDTGVHAQGPVGPQGVQGIQGKQGIQGVQGEKGEKGDPGEKGDIGPTGPQGAPGVQGEKGEPGEDGITPHIDNTSGNWYLGTTDTGVHAQGPKGDIGPQGPQGKQGEPGNGFTLLAWPEGGLPSSGEPGQAYLDPNGDCWAYVGTGGDTADGLWKNVGKIRGPQGEQGDSPHIDLASGHWFVGETDTGVSAQGPKGDTGLQGPQGKQGIQGIQGPTGPQGDPGEKGDTGPTGPEGKQGPTGPQGDPGPKGDDGITPHIDTTTGHWFIGDTDTGVEAQGPRGVQGAPGVQGEKGDPGIQGPIGPQGEPGPQGDPGVAGPQGASGKDMTWHATEIASGADLNTYYGDSKTGAYYTAGGNACLNKPTNVDAFGMVVQRTASGWYEQIMTPSNAETNKLFMRAYQSGSWSAWVEKGATGPQGPKGDPGDIGPEGPAGEDGATGPQGAPGPAGQSGYSYIPSVTSDGTISWTKVQAGSEGATPSPTNIRGPQGAKGDPGDPFTIYKVFTSVSAMNADSTVPVNQYVLIRTADESNSDYGSVYIRTNSAVAASSWSFMVDMSVAIQGPKGDRGETGATGASGYTFTPAVDTSGNLSWTKSQGAGGNVPATTNIKGPKGDTGPQGDPGPTGPTGATPAITATATITNTTGTPSVTVTKSGTATAPKFTFAFKNLKGAQGEAAKTISVFSTSKTLTSSDYTGYISVTGGTLLGVVGWSAQKTTTGDSLGAMPYQLYTAGNNIMFRFVVVGSTPTVGSPCTLTLYYLMAK